MVRLTVAAAAAPCQRAVTARATCCTWRVCGRRCYRWARPAESFSNQDSDLCWGWLGTTLWRVPPPLPRVRREAARPQCAPFTVSGGRPYVWAGARKAGCIPRPAAGSDLYAGGGQQPPWRHHLDAQHPERAGASGRGGALLDGERGPYSGRWRLHGGLESVAPMSVEVDLLRLSVPGTVQVTLPKDARHMEAL